MFLFDVLVANVRQLSPKTTILVHGYDYCLPIPDGPWLGSAMEFRGFSPRGNKLICRAVIKEMVRRFNSRLAELEERNNQRVRYVPLVNTVKNAWWDELHPDRRAAEKLADEFEKAL
jgi:hypothetical protein